MINDDKRWIGCRVYLPCHFGILRNALDIAQESIRIWNAGSGTNVLKAHMLELLKHVLEQPDLPLVGWSDIGATAFGAVSSILPPLPCEERLTESRTGCDDSDGTRAAAYSLSIVTESVGRRIGTAPAIASSRSSHLRALCRDGAPGQACSRQLPKASLSSLPSHLAQALPPQSMRHQFSPPYLREIP